MSYDTGNSSMATVSHSTLARIFVFSIFMIVPLALGSCYVLALYIMIRTQSIFQYSSYKIMILMGFFDLIQLFFLGPLCSIFTIFNVTIEQQSKIPGSVMHGCFYAYILLLIILALERCLKTWYPKDHWETVFGGKKLYAWMSLSFLYCIANMMYFIWGTNSVMYLSDYFSWYYFVTTPWAELHNKIMVGMAAGVMIICYSLIALKLRKMTANISSANDTKRERSILYQCTCTSGCLILVAIVWYWALDTDFSKWKFFLGELSWIINAGMNGMVYTIFNETIKIEMKKIICNLLPASITNKSTVSPIHVISNNATGAIS